MKLISLIQLKYSEFESAVRDYLNKTLGSIKISLSNSTIFGQIINVVSSTTQNILSYIDDALMEHNKYTAQRKRSIYNIAAISGYQPSLGTAARGVINISTKPNNENTVDIILPNKTKISCSNGLIYNILLPQDNITLSSSTDTRNLSIVEGRFEKQSIIATGGSLYSTTFTFSGDIDVDYVKVYVNGERWEYRDSLYDMDVDSKQYTIKTSISDGLDVVFGDYQNGREIQKGDEISIEYLIHTGEYGVINYNDNYKFTFESELKDISGNSVDANSIFDIVLVDRGVSGGTFAENIERVREMIGLNSRSLVLASPKNYKQYLGRFSFVGYNRTWSEKGSLVINSLIIRNFKSSMSSGVDYFSLRESDFYLTDAQKNSILENLNNTGHQLAGSIMNIFNPEIVKYALYIYIKLKDGEYDTSVVTSQIRELIGDFFSNVQSDIFIPKSDIVDLIKNNISVVDGVDVYFISQLNEEALINGKYTNKIYTYNPVTGTYKIRTEDIKLYPGDNPGIGLDEHGNILLNTSEQFPVLMGGWSFRTDDNNIDTTYVVDPLTIIYR